MPGKSKAPDPTPAINAENQRIEKSREIWEGLEVPELESMLVNLQRYDPDSVFIPVLTQWINLKRSELGDIKEDPELRGSQMSALRDMMDITEHEGITPIERAQLYEVQRDIAGDARARRDALKAEGEATGSWGSGLDMLSQITANQGATNEAARQGYNIEADAWQRKLDALREASGLAGNIRSQDLVLPMATATANDAINQFNALNDYNANLRNNALTNAMLSDRQRLAEQNVELQHQEEANRVAATQQDFQNRHAKTSGMAGTEMSSRVPNIYAQNAQQQAQASNQNAANRTAFIGTLISTAGRVAAGGR